MRSLYLSIVLLLLATASTLAAKYPRVVQGTITDVEGNPIAGAKVEYGYFRALEDDRQIVLTDANGKYVLELHEAGVDYRIAVSAQGFAPRYRDRYIPGPKEKPWEFSAQLTPVINTKLRLVTSDGRPVSGAKFRPKTAQVGQVYSSFSSPVSPTPLPGHDQSIESDQAGFVTLGSLPPIPASAYDEPDQEKKRASVQWISSSITVNGRTYEQHIGQEQISKSEPGDPIEIVLPDYIANPKPRDGVILGRVVDAETGEALNKFDIVRRHTTHATAMQTEDGIFELGGTLERGRKYQVRIFKPGYAVTNGRPAADTKDRAAEYVFELKRHPSLKGRLVSSDGKPLANVEILSGFGDGSGYRYIEWSSMDSYADGHHNLKNVLRVKTVKDGKFTIPEAPNQPASLVIRCEGFARTCVAAEKRPEVGPDGLVTIQVKRAATIIVNADRSTQLGKFANCASIGFRSDDGFEHMYHAEKLNENGSKTYESLAPGTYNVSLYRETNSMSYPIISKQITIGEGEEVPVEIGKMEGSLTLSGKVAPFAMVRVSGTDKDNAGYFAINADVDGEFFLSGLKKGNYSYSAQVYSSSSTYRGSGRSKKIELLKDTKIEQPPGPAGF